MLITERYQNQIRGVLSCYDRVVIRGTLPGWSYAQGMTSFLYANQIRIFDYPSFAQSLREAIRENAQRIAGENGVEIEHIRKTKAFRKEERIRDILDAFADCVEYIPEDKFRRKQWLSGARDFVGAHGEDGALLKKAWELYMDIPWDQRQRVIISTPRSLISFAQKVKDNKAERKLRDYDSEENRRRYVEGWLGEDKRDPQSSEARRKKYTTGWFDDGEEWWNR